MFPDPCRTKNINKEVSGIGKQLFLLSPLWTQEPSYDKKQKSLLKSNMCITKTICSVIFLIQGAFCLLPPKGGRETSLNLSISKTWITWREIIFCCDSSSRSRPFPLTVCLFVLPFVHPSAPKMCFLQLCNIATKQDCNIVTLQRCHFATLQYCRSARQTSWMY